MTKAIKSLIIYALAFIFAVFILLYVPTEVISPAAQSIVPVPLESLLRVPLISVVEFSLLW